MTYCFSILFRPQSKSYFRRNEDLESNKIVIVTLALQNLQEAFD